MALDLTPAEQPILDCLPALRAWGVQHVVLTHVMQIGYTQGVPLAHEEEYAAWLEKCALPLRNTGLTVDVRLRASGVPADEILALAGEAGVKLIVLGSRGQNMLSKLFLGSVARAVIHDTNVPVLLEWIEPSAAATRARCEAVCTDTLRRILFATDFSEQAKAAEKAVLELAPRATQVDCVHVLAADQHEAAAAAETSAQAAMADLVERINAAGGQASGTLLQGRPSSEIARYAASQDISMIVVGKRGQNLIASLVIGSTATKLCEIAGRPVLMVP
ncbi:MAG: universal stress protein [Gammaproteobacteria bacterium]